MYACSHYYVYYGKAPNKGSPRLFESTDNCLLYNLCKKNRYYSSIRSFLETVLGHWTTRLHRAKDFYLLSLWVENYFEAKARKYSRVRRIMLSWVWLLAVVGEFCAIRGTCLLVYWMSHIGVCMDFFLKLWALGAHLAEVDSLELKLTNESGFLLQNAYRYI